MKMFLIALCASLLASTAIAKDDPPATQSATYVGTLKGGIMAIGGESTGWMLDYEGGSIMVDVSKAKADAEQLKGKKVSITGAVIEKQYVESGKKKILVAETIKPAGDEKKN